MDDLPEDDSIFMNLSNRTNDLSSDALIEDLSFEVAGTSTPKNKSKSRNDPAVSSRRSPRLAPSSTQSSPQQVCDESPASKNVSPRKKGKTETRLNCPRCSSTLANKRTLDLHLRWHVMKGMYHQ